MGRLNASLILGSLGDLRAGRPVRLAGGGGRRGLVFVHVPKCGGSSVERALRRARPLGRRLVGPDQSFRAAMVLTGLPDEEEARHEILARASELRRDLLHYHLADGARLITGHAPLGPHTLDVYGPTHDVVTVLRSPAERLRSHLAFNRSPRAGHGRSDVSVARFLDTPRARVMGALYVKCLSGLPMSADFTTQGAVDAARRTVDRLALVGFTSEMDLFAAELSALLGTNVRLGHENQGETAELPSGVQDRIRELAAPDDQVYAHARARFAERRATPR